MLVDHFCWVIRPSETLQRGARFVLCAFLSFGKIKSPSVG
jgi:hypothetical protein